MPTDFVDNCRTSSLHQIGMSDSSGTSRRLFITCRTILRSLRGQSSRPDKSSKRPCRPCAKRTKSCKNPSDKTTKIWLKWKQPPTRLTGVLCLAVHTSRHSQAGSVAVSNSEKLTYIRLGKRRRHARFVLALGYIYTFLIDKARSCARAKVCFRGA